MKLKASLLIGEACRIYQGWTADYCLKMPARRFFAMLEAGRVLKINDRIDDCVVAAIAVGGKAQYDQTVKMFKDRLPGEKELPAPKPMLKGKDAANALRAALHGR